MRSISPGVIGAAKGPFCGFLVLTLIAAAAAIGSMLFPAKTLGLEQGIRSQPTQSDDAKRSKPGTNRNSNQIGSTGDLVYGRGNGGFSRIIRKDLTQNPGESEVSGFSDTEPDWSPDGRTIVYAAGRDRGDNSFSREIYIMNDDGTNQRRLTFTTSNVQNGHPRFSPDGTKIVYVEDDGTDPEIKIISASDGSLVNQLTNNDEYEQEPDWSADGSKIVFVRDGDVYVIDVDGSNETLLIDDAAEFISGPVFSPDGQKIAYSKSENTGSDIYIADADGLNPQVISDTSSGTSDDQPTWAPDSHRIAFVSFRPLAGAGPGSVNGIFTVNTDGTSEGPVITDAAEFFFSPSWQPSCGGTPVISSGLVSWWRAENDAADSFGVNHGTLVATAGYTNGYFGQAFTFDGMDDMVNIPDNSSLDVQTGDFTLAAWINLNAGTSDQHYIAGKGGCADYSSSYFLGVDSSNQPYLEIWDNTGSNGTGVGSGNLPLNEWHHMLMRRQGNNFDLFVDGSFAGTVAPGWTLNDNTAAFTIGRGEACPSPAYSTNGSVDEVYLFGRALSDSEVAALASATGQTCSPPAPKLRLKFNGLNPVSAGRQASMTVYLPDFAPAGGVTVDLATIGEPGAITIPSSVFVPEFTNEVTFTIDTAVTNQNKSVDVVASQGSLTGRATVSIHPAVADLTVSNFTAPATVQILQNFTASWTTTNIGQETIPQFRDWNDCVFISADNQFDFNGDTNVGCYYHSEALAVNESVPVSYDFLNIPGSAVPVDGDYYLFVFTNANFRVNERENVFFNNYTSTPIHVVRNLPDYQAINIVAPSEIEPGVSFNVSWDTSNAGSRDTTANTQNQLYFSLDNVAGNTDDLLLYTTVTPPLTIGQRSNNSVPAFIPTLPVRPSSDAFLYIRVDSTSIVYEGENNEPNEMNNLVFVPTRFEYRVPDLLVQSVSPPVDVETDTPFAFAWSDVNSGSRDAGAFHDAVFFSIDAQPSGDDIFLGNFPLDGLAAGQTVARIQNITIPTSAITQTGDYYVYVSTDYTGGIDEGANETNNVTFHSIRVRRFLRPDLEVTNVTAPSTAFFDQTVQVQWTVTNNGPGPTNTNQWQDGVYLSNSPSPSGQVLSPVNVNSLLVGESYITNASFRIPRGSNGSYYIVIRTDDSFQVNEEAENNNVAFSPITINTPPVPDLRISNVQAPDTGFTGQNVSVSWTVTNNGTGATLPGEVTWTDAVYISQDTTLDANDVLIGTRQHDGALAQGGSYSAVGFNATLPSNAIGDRYVFVVTDVYGQLYEFSSEGNNDDYDRSEPGSPMTVIAAPPDLVILEPVANPSTADAGNLVTLSYTVRNQGAFDANGYFFEGVWLSPDQTLSDDDTFIGSSPARVGLAAGSQFTASYSVRLPACINGTFYLLIKTDYNDQIFEYDPGFDAEANNLTQPKQIQITNASPDLGVTATQVPPVANAGLPINVQWTVQNAGGGSTIRSYWQDRVLINTEPNQPPVVLGVFEHNGILQAGASYSQNVNVVLPSYLIGNYQLTIETDSSNHIYECAGEGNNLTATSQFNVPNSLPDLRVSGIIPAPTAVLGTTIAVQFTGTNNGTQMQQQSSWQDAVYISNDNTWQDFDRLIGTQLTSGQLNAGENYSGQISATIPNTPPGNYFLIVLVDAGRNVTEGSPNSVPETNNWLATPITLTAPGVDLQVTNTSVPSSMYSGLSQNISWTVTNTGTANTLTGDWTDYVILSRDSVYDPTDQVLGWRQHNAVLVGGTSYSETMPVYIPAGLTGDYSFFVYTDYGNHAVEGNDANNLGTPQNVTFQLPPPADLNITNITPPASAAPGEMATFNWTVQNSGPNRAEGLWHDTIYLSADSFWDVSDTIVGTETRLGPIDPAATYTVNLNATVPPVDTGTYYIIVRTDARNQVRESDESNNLSSSVGTTTIAVTALTLGVPHNTTLVTGQERFFKYDPPADETLLVTLTGEAGSRNELFTRFGSIVSRRNYQVQGGRQGESDQENVVGTTQLGTYYSMIRGDYVPNTFSPGLQPRTGKDVNIEPKFAPPENVTIKAEILGFDVRRVVPDNAGNQGYSLIQVEGAKFQNGATIRMIGPAGTELLPRRNYFYGPERIAGLFDLRQAAPGNYQVEVRNPNGQTAVWSSNFQVRNGGGPRLRTEIVGPSYIHTSGADAFHRFIVSVSNDGWNDAILVPVIVILSEPFEYQMSTSNYLPADDPIDDPLRANAFHADVNGKRSIALFAPIVRGNSKVEIGIDVKFTRDGSITANAMQPMYDPYLVLPPEQLMNGNLGTATGREVFECWTHFWAKTLLTILSEIFPARCAREILYSLAGIAEDILSAVRSRSFDVWGAFASLTTKAAKSAAQCARDAVKYLPWLKIASIIYDIYQLIGLAVECAGKTLEYILSVRYVRSGDPNEKIGPQGSGPERFVPIRHPMLYRISFENMSTATAPAQQIRVIDQLPSGLDPRSVRLKEIGFKQYRIDVPDNRAFYQGRLQLGADLDNLQADISAGLDIVNNRIVWTLTAIDPMTGEQTLNALQGLLPPDNVNNDGQGYVTFIAEPVATNPTGTVISNTATIYFDNNEPITTNAATNTLDSDVPSSQCAPIAPTQSSSIFTISCGGSDPAGGSGYKSFDLWVSDNGGPYVSYAYDITSPDIQFSGRYGHNYAFYSTANDKAGNTEDPPLSPDTITSVLGGAFEGDVAPRPNGNNNGQVDPGDVDQVRRFVAGLDTDLQLNEYQRADTSPLISSGNGILSVADIVQANRFALALDPVTDAAGPNAAGGFSIGRLTSSPKSTTVLSGLVPHELRVVQTNRAVGKIWLGVELESQGDEVAAGFTLNFDPGVLNNPQNIVLGSGASGAILTVNTNEASQGRLGILIDKMPNQPFNAGVDQLVVIEFDVADVIPSSTIIRFGNSPVISEVVGSGASDLGATFSDSNIVLLPTAAPLTVSGNVVNIEGSGIAQTTVTLVDRFGAATTVRSRLNGYFEFTDIRAGQTYILRANHKKFGRAEKVMTLTTDVRGVELVLRR